MKKWLVLGFGTTTLVVIAVGILLLRDTESGCACSLPPDIYGFTQEKAESYMEIPIPTDAANLTYSGYYLDAQNQPEGGTEAYISFKLTPTETQNFLATIPELLSLEAGYNPMQDQPHHVSNFGAINGTPTKFDSYTYAGVCQHHILVDKSISALYGIYIYVRCP